MRSYDYEGLINAVMLRCCVAVMQAIAQSASSQFWHYSIYIKYLISSKFQCLYIALKPQCLSSKNEYKLFVLEQLPSMISSSWPFII